jgi:chromosome segregation ATPase
MSEAELNQEVAQLRAQVERLWKLVSRYEDADPGLARGEKTLRERLDSLESRVRALEQRPNG